LIIDLNIHYYVSFNILFYVIHFFSPFPFLLLLFFPSPPFLRFLSFPFFVFRVLSVLSWASLTGLSPSRVLLLFPSRLFGLLLLMSVSFSRAIVLSFCWVFLLFPLFASQLELRFSFLSMLSIISF